MNTAVQSHTHKLLPWFVAFFAMHLCMRGIVIVDVSETLHYAGLGPWFRGMASDLLMAVLLAFFSLWLARRQEWLPRVFFAFWAFALAGNREYIGEWAANVSLLDIAGLLDPEFMEGSVLTIRLFVTGCALALVGQAAYMLTQYMGGAVAFSRRYLYIFSVLPVIAFLLPTTPPQLWIQQNIVEENLRQIGAAFVPDRTKPSPSAIAAARRFMEAMRKKDLNGELIATPNPDVNVLIINIESLSDNVIKRGWMPYLEHLSNNALYYPQYILPNLSTIRGLYAQFCGESTYWGRFGRDNMARHIKKAHVHCLPDILTEQGYYTVYMQGAGLHFQNKHVIIPATGFMEVLGRSEMPEGDRFSDWGLDDRSLFSNAQKKIEMIEAENPDTPWMVSLMTVGTHHPYGVNPSFRPELPLRQRAFLYADDALRSFLLWMEKTKRLGKTLIIITGDESREGRKLSTGIGSTITRNQGFLVVLTPEADKERVDTPFMQTDLLMSVLDYAIIEIPPDVGGRSIFRNYTTFRPVAFANYAQQSLYAIWQEGILTQCNTQKWECNTHDLGNKMLFDPAQNFTPSRSLAGPTRALYLENENYWRR